MARPFIIWKAGPCSGEPHDAGHAMTELTPRFAKEARTTAGEVPFEVREHILHTHRRSAGSSRRPTACSSGVSGYDWAEVKGAPHKIIRHPDMPKGAFHLMWNRKCRPAGLRRLRQEPRQDGPLLLGLRADIAPVDGGYALDPHQADLQHPRASCADLRAALLDREQQDGLTPRGKRAWRSSTRSGARLSQLPCLHGQRHSR